ncbi:MAG: ABC transporter permease [Acidimicrobiaceae bacterium]|nr:ABC transporter permease [Acidimicrobiaceae bacterium]
MRRHNLATVVSFEFRRTVTKRRFWIATLIVPVLIATVFALTYFSSRATSNSLSAQKHASFSFTYVDASHLVNPEIASRFGGRAATSVAGGIAAVKSGRIDAFFDYPAAPATHSILVYGKDVGIFNNAKYSSVATAILQASAIARLPSPSLAPIVRGAVSVKSTTYTNGVTSPGLNGVIPPLIYLLVFYLVIVLLGNQMLTSTVEEKENRVTEMILTTVDARTLIIGKILSLFSAGAVQMLVFASPVVVGYVFFRSSLSLPNVNFADLVIAPRPMITGALLLLGGFTLFTGALIAIGAVMPTAKEAGGFFGAVLGSIFIPFYASSLIVSHPTALIVEVFTFFPLTAPVTAMVRNAFGSLSATASMVLVVELFAIGLFVIRMAIRLFQYGSIEYARKVSLRTAFGLLTKR